MNEFTATVPRENPTVVMVNSQEASVILTCTTANVAMDLCNFLNTRVERVEVLR